MLSSALIPWLDPATIIHSAGPYALLAICLIIFAETGLLIGFLFPGDTLLIISGLLTFAGMHGARGGIEIDVWWVCLAVGFAAFLGGEAGYLIGKLAGPRIFERRESGLFSIKNVERTNAFFERFGGIAVVVARFVPIVRTFAPVAAGVARMNHRRYSAYNLVGALVWGSGVTLVGYVLGYVKPIGDFVSAYIDVILLGAVLIAIIPPIIHYVHGTIKARRTRAEQGASDAGTTTD